MVRLRRLIDVPRRWRHLLNMPRRIVHWWRIKPGSGVVRQWFHFVPHSVVLFVVTICSALYVEAAWTFITDKNAISHATIYERVDPGARQVIGALMTVALLNVFRDPAQTGFLVVALAIGLRGYDAIHSHSIAALTVYGAFLIVLPPLFQAMRRRG